MPALPKFNSAAASAADTAVAASTSSPERRGGQRWTERDLQDFLKRNADHPCAPFHNPDEVVICLPMPPTTNNLFAGSGKHRYRTDEYNSWIEDAGWQLATQRPPQVLGRVSLLIEVEEPKTAIKQDVSNRIKATEDLLVRHKIIEGDDQFHVREVTTRWVSGIQGVRVTIRPLASGTVAS